MQMKFFNMENNESKTESADDLLSEFDRDRIETDLYPKAKRGVMWVSAAFLGFTFIAPSITGRHGGRPLMESMGYPRAFLVYFFVFSILLFYFYRKSVHNLRADLLEGRKLIFKTHILKKSWKGHKQFELLLETLPKALSREKFIFPESESHCFHEGDVVVLEFLGRSCVLLRIYAEISQ